MVLDQLGASWRKYRDALGEEIRVLVVDDEPSIREVLSTMLEAEGVKLRGHVLVRNR